MKALTLWQPWASLVALGVKTVETRSWSTPYRGPLAIHAAATPDGFDQLPGDADGNTEAGWRYGYIGDYQAAYCFQSSDEGTRGDAVLHNLEATAMPGLEPISIPLGAVVATCELVNVVPMVTHPLTSPGMAPYPHYPIHAGAPLLREDQGPYGEYAPGRFAWLLDAIVALPEPVPAVGRQQLWEWTP